MADMLKNIFNMLKFKLLLPPQLKDDGDFADNTYIDTQGMDGSLLVLIAVGTTDVAAGDAVGSTAEGTAPLIEECDTTDGDYTAVTDAALSDAIQHDDDKTLWAIKVDLTKSHKRYMRVQAPHSAAGAANGSNLCIIAMGVPQVMPMSAAAMGLEEFVEA